MASKDGVGDGFKTPSEIDKEESESWTSRQIEYLLRRRAAFKGAVTKKSKRLKILKTFSYGFFLSTANHKLQLEVSRLPSEVRTFLSI